MKPEHLKDYNVKTISVDNLLIDWPFENLFTRFLFHHGRKVRSLKKFVIEHKELFYDKFLIVEDDIYYFKNGEFLNLTAVPYPNLIASAIYNILVEAEKNNRLELYAICWTTILDNLLCPLVHNEVLYVLKQGEFFEKIPLQIIKYSIYHIKLLIDSTNNRYFYFYPELKNSIFFYNILTYIGISNKEALALAENCIANNDLNEMKSYLQNLYEKKKTFCRKQS
jgi:hypothetical protein